jgi:hypothetical protein
LNQIALPSAIGIELKLNSIELISVHEPAAADDPLGSDDRSDTVDVDLSARFEAALVTALFTALAALFDELPITRKFPLARDTSAKPTASDRTPSPIRHLRARTESADTFNSDPERVSRGRVSIDVSPFRFSGRL